MGTINTGQPPRTTIRRAELDRDTVSIHPGSSNSAQLESPSHQNSPLTPSEGRMCAGSIMILESKSDQEGQSDKTLNQVPVEDVEPLTLNLAISAPVVAVASPSALRAWLNLISKVDNWNNSIACIGETTASAAKKLGLKSIYYPTTPGLEGWVESILQALRVHRTSKEAPKC
ncbi:unnamed protein product [Miscanthus lutarioriparius]|uniref:Uroporphyrinogen-III synthase n=1 Tax=Miscanthus lutarioriparius TaxID=422564 RepID=A0A811MM28_9POAL|nr:unnamed protein product [Miscanthus lutarioriparius]